MKKHENLYNFIIGMAIGAVSIFCVFVIYIYFNITKRDFSFKWYDLFLLILFIYLAIIIHEFGHFVFGKLTGYKLVSFRIFKYVLRRNEDGKFKIFKKERALGLAGQCLMRPSFKYSKNMPYFLYNAGGAIMNILASGAFLLLLLTNSVFLWHFGTVGISINIILALTNIIPTVAPLPNDGYNIYLIRKYPKAKEVFYKQLEYANILAEGACLEDIEEDYLSYKFDGNPDLITFHFIYWGYLRYLYKNEIEKAGEIIDELYKHSSKFPLSFRNTIFLEYYYYTILYRENISEAYEIYADFKKSFKLFIEKNKSLFPKRIRILRHLVITKNYSLAVIELKEYRNTLKTLEYKIETQVYEGLINYLEEKHLPLEIL